MKRGASFYIVGYISAVRASSSIFYPVYQRSNFNIMFTQIVNRFDEIICFLPFFDIDEYNFIPAPFKIDVRLGDAARFAFMTSSGVVTCDASDIKKSWVNWISSQYSDIHPLLKLQLARIGRASYTEQRTLLGSFLDSIACKPKVRDIWSLSQFKNHQEQSAVWSLVDGQEEFIEVESDPVLPLYKTRENEMNIRWLVDEPVSIPWLKVCSWTFSRVTYDERMFDILAKLVDHLSGNITESGVRERRLISRGIETVFMSNLSESRDFVDSLHDFVASGDIFNLREFIDYRQIGAFIIWMRENNMLRRSLGSIFIDLLRSEDIDGELARYMLHRLIDVRWEIEEDVVERNRDMSQLDELKLLVSTSGRIGLVTSHALRQKIADL